jgi:hypothetical protein
VHREAQGNALKPIAKRGHITKTYPLVIAVDQEQRAQVTLTGGLGHVPVTFTNLNSPKGYHVLVNGQPITHWQTDWNPATLSWKMVCNLAVSEDRETEITLAGE